MTLSATKPSSAHRFHLLDALRGMAALLVTCFHAPGYMRLSFPNGSLAVDFFFCLSGFVMMHAYGEKLCQKMTLREFLIIRILRLWPLYVLGTLIEMCRFPFGQPRLAYAQHHPAATILLFVCGFVGLPNLAYFVFDGELYPFNLPAWSLAYEMLANIGFAASARKRLMFPALIAACTLSLAYLLFIAVTGSTLDSGASIFGWKLALARVGFSFSAGALLFKLRARVSSSTFSSNLFAALLTVVFASVLLLRTSWVDTTAFQFACIVVFFPAMVYCASRVSISGLFLAIAVVLGDMSYPIYVLHEGLIPPAPHNAFALSVQYPHLSRMYGLVVVAVVGVTSWTISRKIELPLRSFLTRKLNQTSATTA